jgi:hypothetical protein
MRVLPGSAPTKWPARAFDGCADLLDPLDEHVIGQGDDFSASDVDIPMHVADEVRDARGFGDVPRPHDQDVLICGRDDVGSLGIVVQELSGVEYGPGRQLQREHDAIGCLDEPADTPPVVSTHREFDDRKSRRGFGVEVENPYRDWRFGFHGGACGSINGFRCPVVFNVQSKQEKERT